MFALADLDLLSYSKLCIVYNFLLHDECSQYGSSHVQRWQMIKQRWIWVIQPCLSVHGSLSAPAKWKRTRNQAVNLNVCWKTSLLSNIQTAFMDRNMNICPIKRKDTIHDTHDAYTDGLRPMSVIVFSLLNFFKKPVAEITCYTTREENYVMTLYFN